MRNQSSDDARQDRASNRKKTLDELDRKKMAEFNEPENVARREWLKEVWQHDIDQLAHFTVVLLKENETLHKVNGELVEKLNHLHSSGSYFSSQSKLPPHSKKKAAQELAKADPSDLVAEAFLSALTAAKTLAARSNASKAHEVNNKLKAFVQAEWQLHKDAFESNKSAFSRQYVRRLKKDYDYVVTEKQMREVWLKAPPSASKPDRMLGDG